VQAPPRPATFPRQPPPPAVEMRRQQDTIADLLTRAAATDVPRMVRAADKIQDLVDQLETDVAEHERGTELRAEAARLEARLAEIKSQISGKQTAASATSVDTKAVRAWAASQGLECPARGRVPRSVMDAYQGRVVS
jgi:predicted trehalose synthase